MSQKQRDGGGGGGEDSTKIHLKLGLSQSGPVKSSPVCSLLSAVPGGFRAPLFCSEQIKGPLSPPKAGGQQGHVCAAVVT